GGGAWATVDEACAACVRVRSKLEPGADAELMNARYEKFQTLYPALRHLT
ncbi:MAG: hypothetical protein H7Z38_11740, partial [Rubrivivax sp.]|nr:hypothetical protein [Pyrinomonadaceae bacterium]